MHDYICPYCGNRISDGARYCNRCGRAVAGVAAAFHCNTCGRKIDPKSKFCPYCNARVTKANTRTNAADGNQENGEKRRHSRGCGCIFHSLLLLFLIAAGSGYYYLQLMKAERVAYNKVKSSHDLRQMKEYIDTDFHVFSDHKDDIVRRMEQMRTDRIDYQAAQTVATCEAYLRNHPDGKYAAEVKKRLERLRRLEGRDTDNDDDRSATGQPVERTRTEEPVEMQEAATEDGEVPDESAYKTEQIEASVAAGNSYYVQYGYRARLDDAKAAAARGASKGHGNVVAKKHGASTRYYITSGPYATREEAQQALLQAKNDYPDATIIQG